MGYDGLGILFNSEKIIVRRIIMYAVQRVSVVDVAFGGGPSFSDVFQQTMGEVALPEIP
jgi:hypothetical protein